MKTVGGKQTHSRLANAGVPLGGMVLFMVTGISGFYLKNWPLAFWCACSAFMASRAMGEEEWKGPMVWAPPNPAVDRCATTGDGGQVHSCPSHGCADHCWVVCTEPPTGSLSSRPRVTAAAQGNSRLRWSFSLALWTSELSPRWPKGSSSDLKASG